MKVGQEIRELVANYKFTEYFEQEVLRKRPYLKKEWCIYAVENAIRSEPQEHDRFRFWAPIADFGGRYLTMMLRASLLASTLIMPARRLSSKNSRLVSCLAHLK